MRLIGDLHIHSKYSRGCSNALDIDKLEKYAKIKGIDFLGTGDFTHPKWIKEIKKKLSPDSAGAKGILRTKSGFPFVMQTELSLIYTQGDKGKRVHNVVLAPSIEVAEQITDELKKRGRVDYDGRPIFKIPCPEFTEMLRKISKEIEVIPAHIWTPHFSVLGDYNKFNNIQECFLDQTKHIHALETGISSDPPMNWRLSCLDKFNLVSFSDLHSYWPWRIGREATIFDINLTYKTLLKSLRTGKGLWGTIEVDPAYGKYHEDGHRKCNVWLNPKQSAKHDSLCPKCGKGLIIGVNHRVNELADRPEGFVLKNAKKHMTLIPLTEILSKVIGKGLATKTIWTEYNKLMTLGNEMKILTEVSFDKINKVVGPTVAKAIMLNREGKIKVQPGYDGLYGEPIFGNSEIIKQKF